MSNGSKQQTLGARIPPDVGGKPGLAPAVSAVPAGLVPAWFTERELTEMRKVCRDYEGELAERFLKTALARAESKP